MIDLNAIRVSNTKMTLGWSASDSSRQSGYNVEYRKGSVGDWSMVDTVHFSLTINDLHSGCSYTFRVRAYSGPDASPVYGAYETVQQKTCESPSICNRPILWNFLKINN